MSLRNSWQPTLSTRLRILMERNYFSTEEEGDITIRILDAQIAQLAFRCGYKRQQER